MLNDQSLATKNLIRYSCYTLKTLGNNLRSTPANTTRSVAATVAYYCRFTYTLHQPTPQGQSWPYSIIVKDHLLPIFKILVSCLATELLNDFIRLG